MKKFIALTAALLSLSAFAGRYDRVELVRIKGETAQGVFAEAQAMAAEVNADRWGRTKFSFLRTCNPTHSDLEDGSFRRKAFANSGKVYLNHVTGMYTAILDVRCED